MAVTWDTSLSQDINEWIPFLLSTFLTKPVSSLRFKQLQNTLENPDLACADTGK